MLVKGVHSIHCLQEMLNQGMLFSGTTKGGGSSNPSLKWGALYFSQFAKAEVQIVFSVTLLVCVCDESDLNQSCYLTDIVFLYYQKRTKTHLRQKLA